jgi:hypothetical protein
MKKVETQVKTTCLCGQTLTGWFFEDGVECDFVHCECGHVYVISKPFIGNVKGMHLYVTDKEVPDDER